MFKGYKKVVCLILVMLLTISMFSGCSKSGGKTDETETVATNETAEPTAKPSEVADVTVTEEPTVIRWGWHNMKSFDPYKVDEVTGEYTMAEADRQAALAALAKVKEELNVEVEFVQYTQDVRSELITSVLAGNPIVDIACMWGGSESTILAQNILQELDDYQSLYEDPEYSWMMYDKVYGHNYFFSWKQTFYQRWPLVYNISMIEKVDSLKDENGNTIYPTDLFFEGKWTWNTFKDYLSKIQTYYANVAAPEGSIYDKVKAYETDWRFAALSATYSAGGSIYGSNGLEVNGPAAIKAAKYIADMKDSGIMVDPGTYSDGFIPQWTRGGQDFQNGATVFTDCPDWWITGSASAAADRGEAIGIVAWPRPDDMAFEDENYRQVVTVGDSAGILKGVSPEKTKKALEFWRLYWKTFYEVYGSVDSVVNFKEEASAAKAAAAGFDIFNEKYGDDVLKSFQYIAGKSVGNDYSDLIGVRGTWDVILGKGLYGIDGTPAYDVAIEASMDQFSKVISNMETILSSNDIRDNIAPSLEVIETIALPVGTDPTTITWASYFKSEDAVEGILDTTTGTYDPSGVDFSIAGVYSGLVASIKDGSGNENKKTVSVSVYDPSNTTPPVITVVEEYRTIKVDEDTSKIAWKGDFIASAVDTNGIDVVSKLTADLSDLDTTTPGEYDVLITVVDFAGNESSVTLTVEVKGE